MRNPQHLVNKDYYHYSHTRPPASNYLGSCYCFTSQHLGDYGGHGSGWCYERRHGDAEALHVACFLEERLFVTSDP